MGYVAVLVIGMVLLVVGAQGGIRLLLEADPGILSWMPGGSTTRLVAYVLMTALGVALAVWGRDRARRRGSLD